MPPKNKKTVVHIVVQSFERDGRKLSFGRKKPRGSVFVRRTTRYTQYNRGRDIILVPRKNVILKRD